MARKTFLEALEYLHRAEINQVRLLGGEPTLHQDFHWILDQSLKRGFQIVLFSNGLISPETLEYLARIEEERIIVLLNTVFPSDGESELIQKQRESMSCLGRRCRIGANIFSRKQNLSYLIDYITKFGLYPEIRLGIAHPLLSGRNVYLQPKFYFDIGLKIVSLYFEAKEVGIELSLDCGFVPCMFPEDSWKELGEALEGTGRYCRPNLDLLPNGEFISCYPLNNQNKLKLTSNITAQELRSQFDFGLSPFQIFGIFPNCGICSMFGSRCNGGCVAQKINRLVRVPL